MCYCDTCSRAGFYAFFLLSVATSSLSSIFNFQQFTFAVFELRSVGQCRAMNRGTGLHSSRGIGLRIYPRKPCQKTWLSRETVTHFENLELIPPVIQLLIDKLVLFYCSLAWRYWISTYVFQPGNGQSVKRRSIFLRDGLTGVGELVDGSLELGLGLPII